MAVTTDLDTFTNNLKISGDLKSVQWKRISYWIWVQERPEVHFGLSLLRSRNMKRMESGHLQRICSLAEEGQSVCWTWLKDHDFEKQKSTAFPAQDPGLPCAWMDLGSHLGRFWILEVVPFSIVAMHLTFSVHQNTHFWATAFYSFFSFSFLSRFTGCWPRITDCLYTEASTTAIFLGISREQIELFVLKIIFLKKRTHGEKNVSCGEWDFSCFHAL